MLGLFILMSFTLSSCDRWFFVVFSVTTTLQDTIVVQKWGQVNSCDTLSCIDSPGTPLQFNPNSIIVCTLDRRGGGRYASIPQEEAFATLISNIDSIRIIRKSDGASTITYRHDENATEAQRYFFTRDAWTCYPEGEELYGRGYQFIATNDMFQ